MKLYFRMWTGINYVVVSKFMHICMNLRQLVKYLIWVLVSLLLLFVILRTFHLCHQMGNCFVLVPYLAIINPWEFFSAPQLQEPQEDSRVCVLPSPRFLVMFPNVWRWNSHFNYPDLSYGRDSNIQHSACNKTYLHVSLLTYFFAQSGHLPVVIKKSFYDELFGSLMWNY